MTKVAFGSDFHIDVTKQPILEAAIEYLRENQVDIFSFAGDMSADVGLTLSAFEQIESETHAKVIAVPGNHETWDTSHGTSFDALRIFDDKGASFSAAVNPLEFGDWVILGNIGWYDYSTAPTYLLPKQIEKMRYRNMTWKDKTYCDWEGSSNPEVANEHIESLKKQLDLYSHKHIILLSHFVPYQECIRTTGHSEWDYFNSYIGNNQIGYLADTYKVKLLQFGHTHIRHHRMMPSGVELICSPLGYYGEWTSKNRTIVQEIKKAIPIFDL